MTTTHTIIDTLLLSYTDQYAIPEGAQELLNRLRQRLIVSESLTTDLSQLHGVASCDRLALGLLWVCERSAADPAKTEPTPEEVEAVHGGITSALTALGFLGEQPEGGGERQHGETTVLESGSVDATTAGEETVAGQPTDDTGMTPDAVVPVDESVAAVEPPAEEPMTVPEDVSSEPTPGGEDTGSESPATPTPPAGDGTTDTAEIGQLLERFLDALQSGTDERETLLGSLQASFAACIASDATDPSLRQYAEVVGDFLGYIKENELLDDVRVMNFFTNIQEPYDQWIKAAEGEREGLLEQAIEFLNDFRAMFE